jgi:hypothetical protein
VAAAIGGPLGLDDLRGRHRPGPEVVRRELAIIRDDLHCTAVQIIGGDADRMELAARYAAELGLEVWFSPAPLEIVASCYGS